MKIVKRIIKGILFAIGLIIVFPFALLARLFYNIVRSTLFYDMFCECLSLTPGIFGTIGRACYYKLTLKKSYLDLDIGFGSLVSKIETSIGRGVLITGHTTIGLADIGDRAVIANYVSILSGRYQHNFSDLNKDILANEDSFNRIKIGNDSFIGDNSTIMANIGEFSIIGAGSVVVKDIPAYVVAVGNPARVIKQRKQ
jgi:acetyltransferase-like isoleucine patch superfamily enzyme